MNISAAAIRYPIIVILFFLVVIIAGIRDYNRLEVDDAPALDIPMIIITISQIGAAPKDMEENITKKLEDSLVGIESLKSIVSSVGSGISTTTVEFKIGTNPDRVLNKVKDALARIRGTLPKDISEPNIVQPTMTGAPFINYSISSNKYSLEELTRIVDNQIGRFLISADGISQVKRTGGLDREIQVELKTSQMQALGITVDEVNSQIKEMNLNLPSGKFDLMGNTYLIRTLGSFHDIEHLKEMKISLSNNKTVKLKELATVRDTFSEQNNIARLNGKNVLALSVTRSQGTSIISADKSVRKKIMELEKQLPDIKFSLINSFASYTYDSYNASIDALLLGGTLAIIVIFIFLRNWQATLIGALAIPLSVLGTFTVMVWLDYTLNFMTLLALILVVGILVDDAIVDLENIHRHISMGKKPIVAAIEATNEIGLAVLATTLTIVAVFIPVSFMEGISGQYFKSFGVTVSISVLFSLLIARTLTPMMAAYLLPEHAKAEDDKKSLIERVYGKIIIYALKHRLLIIILAIIIFIVSIKIVPLLPQIFFDEVDNSELSISVNLPPGAGIKDTDQKINEVIALMKGHQEIKQIFPTVGDASVVGGLIDASGLNKGTIYITMVPKSERNTSAAEFEKIITPLFSDITGARISFNHFGAGTGGGKPVNIQLKGNDPILLDQASDNLLTEMRNLLYLKDVTSSAAEMAPEIIIKLYPERAAEHGISATDIGRIVRIAAQGDLEENLSKLMTPEKQINIRVYLPENSRKEIEEIRNLWIRGKKGLVNLKSIAELELSRSSVSISRKDRERYVTISANLHNESLGQAIDKIYQLKTIKNLPKGVEIDSEGEAKLMEEVFGNFANALVSAVLFIYCILVILFGSFLHPLTIMIALPLSIGGAVFALLITNKALGLMSLVGIIMLMGIVTKNSILLVEFAVMSQKQGINRAESLVLAGLARLRPIIMTTIAMIAGMMPIALSMGTGTAEKSPMAVAVIGGLISSTLFTLIVVPAFYTYVDDLKNLAIKLFIRKKQPELLKEKEEINI